MRSVDVEYVQSILVQVVHHGMICTEIRSLQMSHERDVFTILVNKGIATELDLRVLAALPLQETCVDLLHVGVSSAQDCP